MCSSNSKLAKDYFVKRSIYDFKGEFVGVLVEYNGRRIFTAFSKYSNIELLFGETVCIWDNSYEATYDHDLNSYLFDITQTRSWKLKHRLL